MSNPIWGQATTATPVRSLYSAEPEMEEFLRGYVASMDGKRARLRALLLAGDLAGLREEAHQIAGSAGSYGFPEISGLAAAAEKACSHEDAGAAAVATLELIAHLARIAP